MDARGNLWFWVGALGLSGQALAAGNSAPPSVFGYVVLLVVMAGVGVLSTVDVVQKRARLRRALSWPVVEARVTETAIEQKARPTKVTPRFIPRITYAFTMGGKDWKGTMLQYGDPLYRSEKAARERLAPYSAGAFVMVYVNPDDPSESVIDPKQDMVTSVLIALPCFAIAAYAAWKAYSLAV